MKHCPKCKSQYPDEMSYCLIDGDSLLANDPEATTLKGEVTEKHDVFPVRGEAVDHAVTLKTGIPFSLIHPGRTVIVLLKGIYTNDTDYQVKALIGFYGDLKFLHGRRVERSSHNEYFLVDTQFHDPDDVGLYSLSLAHGWCQVFRAYVDKIDEEPGEVKLQIGLLMTELDSFPRVV